MFIQSFLLRYAKSKPNGKLLVNSTKNGPYVRRMIHEPGDLNGTPHVAESTHEQTDDELTDKEEIWLRVEQMMRGSTIGAQEKMAKLFNEWEKFKSTDGESIKSYYHRFSKLMNDFSREKHFPEKIASNLKFLNNLQPEWKRYVTTVHQTKDLKPDWVQCRADYRESEWDNAVQNAGNQVGIADQNANENGNGNVVAARAKGTGNGNPAAAGDIDEIKEVNAICILMANLQQVSKSGTQTDKAPVYDSDGSAEVHYYENCYDNEIFNMFTQEEQYTELFEPITDPYPVQQNNSNVIPMESSMEHNEGTIEQHPAIVEETHAYFESLYNNLVTEVEKVNTVNRKMKETNTDLTTELDEIAPIVHQVETRVQNFKNHFLKEAAKFVRNFKSLAKEADESLDKITVLEKENELLLRAVVNQDIMSIVQRPSVVETSDL
ncbi:hypothetical protein Tco_0375005 [Tanacetum coccineum]